MFEEGWVEVISIEGGELGGEVMREVGGFLLFFVVREESR